MVGKVNVDDEQELAIRYGVMSIPTVIFFKDGKEIDRKVGVMPAGAFTQVLDDNHKLRRTDNQPAALTGAAVCAFLASFKI
ncbi:MAG: thioredoxin domain-containing protein [Lawsonibacter sp.]